MKLEIVINILGDQLGKNLIVKRTMDTDPIIKAYKTYRIELYEAKNSAMILGTQIRDKIIDTNKDSIVNKVEETFLNKVFEYYGFTRDK